MPESTASNTAQQNARPRRNRTTVADVQKLVADLSDRVTKLESAAVPQESMDRLVPPVNQLSNNIQGFIEQENIYGPQPETMESYLAHQTAVLHSYDDVYQAYHDDAPKTINEGTVSKAVDTANTANDFWKQEFAKLKERETKMQQQMTSMREQMEELQKSAEAYHFTPEQLSQSMALAMAFIENADKVRKAAHTLKHPASAQLFQDARQAVDDTYQAVVGAPKRAANAIKNKAYDLADRAINRIAGVFDRGITFLSKRRNKIASMSPLYKETIEQVPTQENPVEQPNEAKDVTMQVDAPHPWDRMEEKWKRAMHSERPVREGIYPEYLTTEKGQTLPENVKSVVKNKILDTLIADHFEEFQGRRTLSWEKAFADEFLDRLTYNSRFVTKMHFTELDEERAASHAVAVLMTSHIIPMGTDVKAVCKECISNFVPFTATLTDPKALNQFMDRVLESAQKEPEMQLYGVDYFQFSEDFNKLNEMLSKFQKESSSENATGFRDAFPENERIFLEKLAQQEQKPASKIASIHDALAYQADSFNHQKLVMKAVAREAFQAGLIQADVEDFINKYCPGADSFKRKGIDIGRESVAAAVEYFEKGKEASIAAQK